MTKHFATYQAGVRTCLDIGHKLSESDRFTTTRDWYRANGRAIFVMAFEHETKQKLNSTRNPGSRIEIGLPKSPRDVEKKMRTPLFYAVQSEWFLQETDRIFEADGRCVGLKDGTYYPALNGILQKYLLDSQMILADFSNYAVDVPGVFPIGKNRTESNVALFHAGWQAIFGNHSPLSFADNHADTAISHLRMNIELRLRHGFGVLGKIDKKTDSFSPISLSEIIESIEKNLDAIKFGVPFAHIERAYRWANLYLHAGFKLYTWCTPAALDYLAPFLVGRGTTNIFSGIRTSRAAVIAIQENIKSGFDQKVFELLAIPPEDCELALSPNPRP